MCSHTRLEIVEVFILRSQLTDHLVINDGAQAECAVDCGRIA